MVGMEPQLTAAQVLRTFHHDELYLFLGAAFTTVGLVAAALASLGRKRDPLFLWLALFATLSFASPPPLPAAHRRPHHHRRPELGTHPDRRSDRARL